jgi:enediyne biosynthesis protein E4
MRKLLAALLAITMFVLATSYRGFFPKDKFQVTPIFSEVANEVGLDFHHYTGATGEFFLPEIMGSGVALFDYDGDGDLDVYLLQGALLDKQKSLSDSMFPPLEPPHNKLFRNDLVETGRLHFTDVTAKAGVGYEGYGMGVAVGDYDSDGDLDLYLTNFGSNVLYRNNGDGTFTDVTAQAGVDDPRWSTGAAFLDYDHDGDLDLFVVNYLAFTVRGNKKCYNVAGERDYCSPSIEEPLPSRLFRNEGNGRFVDVTEEAGIGSPFGAGLGVACADFNSDGRIDIYVANDGYPNQLWVNKGDGTFKEVGLISGSAVNADGKASAGMGVTVNDFDNDGDEDLFVTNLINETNTLYLNDGNAFFHDATIQYGLARASLPYTGFGTEFFDYDNDGRLDLFVANGAVTILQSLRGTEYPFRQINQLFRNEGKFRELTKEAGPALELSEVSRGAAFGDIDNDGDVDIVVTNNNGPVRLLRNEVGSLQHWIEVRLEGVRGNPSGLGARVAALRKDQAPLWRRVHTDGSYLSANDFRVHFGLGQSTRLEAVIVEWPAGDREVWRNPIVDKILTLRQGTGSRTR